MISAGKARRSEAYKTIRHKKVKKATTREGASPRSESWNHATKLPVPTATDPRSAHQREREDETNLDDRIVPTGNSTQASQVQQQRRASSVDLLTTANSSGPGAGMMRPISSSQSVMTDAQGLIVPKKLVNPVLESIDRQNLHREMMFNQKIGKSVLNQKSELQRALEKQKERQVLAAQNLAKQTEQTIATELGRVIMQRAQRLEQQKGGSGTGGTDPPGGSINPEYLNARAKLRATVDTK